MNKTATRIKQLELSVYFSSAPSATEIIFSAGPGVIVIRSKERSTPQYFSYFEVTPFVYSINLLFSILFSIRWNSTILFR
jgi:hypothetical protein